MSAFFHQRVQTHRQSTKSPLCSLQVFVNTLSLRWSPATMSSAHHEPCSAFGSTPWFCIFDGALAAEGEEEKRWVSSVMSAVRLQQCHLREAARERARGFALARRAWTSVLILILPAALPLPFEVLSILLHCAAFLLFLSLHRAAVHIDAMSQASDWQMESKAKWARSLSPSLTTAAPSATSSCCWIIK